MAKINYDHLTRESLKFIVKKALQHTAHKGLSGHQHFLITFRPDHPQAVVPGYILESHPEELTIILENHFWNLEVFKDYFSVAVNLNDCEETLHIPFNSLIEFQDPSEDFILMFEPVYDEAGEAFDEEDPFEDNKVVSLEAFKNKTTKYD